METAAHTGKTASRTSKHPIFRPILIALFLVLTLVSTRILSSPDLGWHLAGGKRIVEERAIPSTDNFSYTKSGSQWWVNQGLAEVLFYAVYESLGGYDRLGGHGLIALRFVIMVLLFLALYRSGRLGAISNEIVAGSVLFLALLASSTHLLVRPFLISALFLGWTGLIVEGYRRRQGGKLWVLPLLFAVWAHVHPGFLYGAALLGSYIAGEWIRSRFSALRGDVKPLTTGELAKFTLYSAGAVGAALASGALFNPSGIEAILLPIGLMKTKFFFEVLSEFQRAHFWRDRYFTAIAILTIASLVPRRRRDATEIIAIAIFGYFALEAVRVIIPFTVVAAPIAIRNWSPSFDRLFRGRPKMVRSLTFAIATAILVHAAWLWTNDPLRIRPASLSPRGQSALWGEITYPIPALQFIEREELPGEVFHPDQFGGPFIWHFYPDRKNFVDGRVEVYGEDFWQNEYFRILACGPGWEDHLQRHGVNTLLLRPGTLGGSDRINASITKLGSWALVYFDDHAVVYVRRNAMDESRLSRLEIPGVNPLGLAAPRSWSEEAQALDRLGQLDSRRALLLHSQILADRDEWETLALLPDLAADVRGTPADRWALYRIRGEARFRGGNIPGAKEDWLISGPSEAVQNNLALLEWLDGEPIALLASDSNNRPDELTRLAALLRGAGRYEEAVELIRHAMQLRSGDSFLHNSLAWTLLEGGSGIEAAIREAKEAVRLSPDDGYARGTFARALTSNGDLEGAERELRRSIELLPASDYRTGAKERGKLSLLLARRAAPSLGEEISALASEALQLDGKTESRDELMTLIEKYGAKSRD